MGARNREGIGLSYQPARLHRLAELIPVLLKSLKIRALISYFHVHELKLHVIVLISCF
jgi:hypothetical protein